MEQNKKKLIGSEIKKARNRKGLTQAYVAENLNMSRSYMSDLENGRYMPSVETLVRLIKYLDINLNIITKM